MPASPDLGAVTAALTRMRPRLVGLARAIVLDDLLAEDVVQEVAVRLLDEVGRFNDAAHVEAWLARVTRHRAIDAYRRQQRGPVALSDAALAALEGACLRVDDEPVEALRVCLGRLSGYGRKLVALRYERGIKGEALASALGRKPNAVYTALGRVQRQLASCIQAQLRERAS